MESSQGMTAMRVERTISDSLRSGVSLFLQLSPGSSRSVSVWFLWHSGGTGEE